MAKWVDRGHAMRRREGAPMNHLESAGPTSGRMHDTSEEQYEAAKNTNSPRTSIGEEPMSSHENIENSMSPIQDADDYTAKAASPEMGTMVAKHNTQAGDPTAGGVGHRNNVMYNERLGASYKVTVNTDFTVDPTVGPTMANARVIPSVQGRQSANFSGAITDQY